MHQRPYAAVLSLDAAADPTKSSAPVRHAILDRDSDEDFDDADIIFLESNLTGPLAGSKDFSRDDLNGDGFTGGDETARFDLDRIGSRQFGAAEYSNCTVQSIEGQLVAFDETKVTDMDVLCYYAYQDEFFEGTSEIRKNVLGEICGSSAPAAKVGSETLAAAQTTVAETCEEAQLSVDFPEIVNNFAPIVISLTDSQGPIADAPVGLTITFPDDNPNFVTTTGGTTNSNGIFETTVSMQGARRVVVEIEAREGNAEGPVLAQKTVSATARYFGIYAGTATLTSGGVTSPPFAFTLGLGARSLDGTGVPPGPSEATVNSSAPNDHFDVTFSGSDFTGGHVQGPSNPNFISITGTASPSTASGVIASENGPSVDVFTFTAQCADVCIVN